MFLMYKCEHHLINITPYFNVIRVFELIKLCKSYINLNVER